MKIIEEKEMRKLEKESKEMNKESFKFAWVTDSSELER
jgi:translation elongation factor EF-1alpha